MDDYDKLHAQYERMNKETSDRIVRDSAMFKAAQNLVAAADACNLADDMRLSSKSKENRARYLKAMADLRMTVWSLSKRSNA